MAVGDVFHQDTTMHSRVSYIDDLHTFHMINNYLYLYHLNRFIVLPTFAESVSDTSQANFASSTPLSRSAPIYSYQGSGPRVVQVNLNFHREMMAQINYNNASYKDKNGKDILALGDDYVDELIKQVQAAVLPSYEVAKKMVNPPIVALRMGDDIFIKGIIMGNIGLNYKTPILKNGKYALVDFSLTIHELDPYDAKDVIQTGSYRASSSGNLSTTLARS